MGIAALDIVEGFAMTDDMDEMGSGILLLQVGHCCGLTTRSNFSTPTVDDEKGAISALSRHLEGIDTIFSMDNGSTRN